MPTPLPPTDAAIATAEAAGDRSALALAYYERGNVQLDQGNSQAAIADYDRALAINTGNARIFNNRGLAYAGLGRTDQALADYSEAIRLDPSYVRAYRNRLPLLEQRGELRQLAADYDRLAMLEPANLADYRYHQGSALQGLRDLAGARRAYDTALQSNPQHVDALYQRALLSMAEGQHAAAIRDLDIALRLSPRAANAYYARGLAHTHLPTYPLAISDFTRALEFHPGYAEALLGRAAAYHASGDTAHASADLDQLETLSLEPAFQAAVAALRQQLTPPR